MRKGKSLNFSENKNRLNQAESYYNISNSKGNYINNPQIYNNFNNVNVLMKGHNADFEKYK